MILSSTIPVTQTQLKLVSLWIHSPIALGQDKNPGFVVSRQTRLKDRYILRAKLICLIGYSLFLLFNGLWHLHSPSLLPNDKGLVALFSFCAPTVVLGMITSIYQYPADFVILLNMILTYERRVLNTETKDYHKIVVYGKLMKRALQLFGLCGSLFLEVFGVLVFIVKMGKPPFLGSIIPGS